MLSCHDVARYFLAQCDEEAGDLISNLKLQKLVYYAQGFSLALLGRPLFVEEIEAWQHGPVVPALYHEYKQYGSGSIPIPQDIDYHLYSDEEKELLDEVASVYGQFSAWKLRNMTHEEAPWASVQHAIPCEISQDSLSAFFRTRVQ
ncbi:Panacea domain-containing protein [Robbsia andropogonis]|uniref:Panacea domain-containing protein n=1 Tax=Robbsia andropogonis TaxID=28092 RepID=UPI003D255F99